MIFAQYFNQFFCMNIGAWIVLLVITISALVVLFYKRAGKKIALPAGYKNLLLHHVGFYRSLNDKDKIKFEEELQEFLSYVRINGVETTVEAIDRLLVAASAVIPTFGFNGWKYNNLREVLLYPASFDKEKFLLQSNERNTLGMVGNGPMQRVMILSKPALHEGFANEMGKDNTGIHEFVHLLDKDDGDVDGLPETLLNGKYTTAWIQLVNENIDAIKQGNSDINTYGATNKAEFFAVAAEYFFKRPDLFKERHEALFNMMVQIFNQSPSVALFAENS
jgi:Mlc titration factor MtfA (ptsG expression regulator)